MVTQVSWILASGGSVTLNKWLKVFVRGEGTWNIDHMGDFLGQGLHFYLRSAGQNSGTLPTGNEAGKCYLAVCTKDKEVYFI